MSRSKLIAATAVKAAKTNTTKSEYHGIPAQRLAGGAGELTSWTKTERGKTEADYYSRMSDSQAGRVTQVQ